MSVLFRSPRGQQRLILLLNVGALVIVVGTVWVCLQIVWPRPAWTTPEISPADVSSVEPETEPELTLADLAVIWQRDLHQPVVDPPPAKPAAPPPEPKLAIRLVGTAVESDRQFGIFQLAGHRSVVKPVGATIDGFEIVSIERGRARLRRGERIYDLEVPWYERLAATPEDVHDER